jgi:hypothetical protein
MIRSASLAAVIIACLFGMRGTALAAPPSASVTVTSATVVFSAVDMSTASLAGSTTVTASVTFTTSAAGGGTIVITPPGSLLNTAGTDSASPRDITATCTRTGGNNGFTSSGAVQLNGATVCATLAANKSAVTTTFSIKFTLNDTDTAPIPFHGLSTGDKFGPGTFSVTGTAS